MAEHAAAVSSYRSYRTVTIGLSEKGTIGLDRSAYRTTMTIGVYYRRHHHYYNFTFIGDIIIIIGHKRKIVIRT